MTFFSRNLSSEFSMDCIVTGCAGFIGSNLVDRLLHDGHSVTGVDNFSTGQMEFLAGANANPNFQLYKIDLLDLESLEGAFRNADIVFHLAANADVRFGTENPRRDLEQNTIATHNVLEAMRKNEIKKIVFSSTGSVYGEADLVPTPETSSFPIQTSLYGASKAAGEGLISAYCEGFDFQAWIFRFVSILGNRYTHGHVFDFYQKLAADPNHLLVLGNGKQKKSYLCVEDCLNAMLLAIEKAQDRVNIFNLGLNEYCEVNDSISWICKELGVNPKLQFTGGSRGWVGDNPFIFLDTSRIQALGWVPNHSIKDGILQTLSYLKANDWVFNARSLR